MPTPVDVRAHLVAALEADLVGPFYPEDHAGPRDELLQIAPSRWYLTGFLAPQGDQETESPEDDEDENASLAEDDDEEPSNAEAEAKQLAQYQASMGMSVLLPAAPASGVDRIRARVRFADYVRVDEATGEGKKRRVAWRRFPRPEQEVEIDLEPAAIAEGRKLPQTPAVVVCGKLESAEGPGLDGGTRALSLFVVNRRPVGERGRRDEQFLFQVELELEYAPGFVPRPNRQGEAATDFDDRVSDVQFRDHREWAVGHGVAVARPDASGPVTRLRTTWIPRHEVLGVTTHEDSDVETSMDALGALADGASVRAALAALPRKYAAWIEGQRAIPLDSARREETREKLVEDARTACARIAAGIERLATDAEALEAFQLANRAMASAARQRSPQRYPAGTVPRWRLFQLAFVLLNVDGLVDERHADRKLVELIFFPTGGGKTEAYLGAIAFTLVLRRLRGQARPDRGLGVAVLLRYTLRLLTLDQLGRAATLVCALEMLRRERPERLGDVRFTVGLWVGKSATANTMAQVSKQVIEFKNSSSKNASSPFPLTNCPWCGRRLGRDSLVLGPDRSSPEEVVVSCATPAGEPPSDCDFSPRKNPEGLPVVFVDEQVYRELPSFLVATVDKFAMLPWRGETGMLFGRVTARAGRKFLGPLDGPVKHAMPLAGGLRPPELIVQDELHLIAGPLGTMVGLYETAIEHLSVRREDGVEIRPKILASTATLRRAREQIRGLFGRGDTALFPPPGVDPGETWFARVRRDGPGRLYAGVAASGRSMKAILLRSYSMLLSAAQQHFEPKGAPDQAADPYMTLVGYFNSIRELGGMRRLAEDDVKRRTAKFDERVPVGHRGPHPWGRARTLSLPYELTSRIKAGPLKETKDRLGNAFVNPEHVDVLLASNMISVGVDIDRLGLMVVAGQPKTTSEYIQASSRVGRQYPGLVVTCFNVRKPRDRSHYERFVAYHESFYRYVEATSVTPFSGPALDRGLAGTLFSMVRLGETGMTPPRAAMDIGAHLAFAEACATELAERAGRHAVLEAEEFANTKKEIGDRAKKLVTIWRKITDEARVEGAAKRSYSRFDREKSAGSPLLHCVTDDNLPPPQDPESRLVAPTSMRDVEPSVHLWLERGSLGGRR